MKKRKKKPRIDVIHGVTSGIVSKLTISHDISNDSFQVHELDPNTITLSRGYQSDSGKHKTLSKFNTNNSNVSFDNFTTLQTNCDHLIAIDTNYKEIGGIRVAVTSSYIVPKSLSGYTNQVTFIPFEFYVATNISDDLNPEVFGWHIFLSRVHMKDKRHGVIVDGELSEHPNYNSRKTPYYRNHYLPENFNFIYASDSAADSLQNKMIRLCDKAGSKIMNIIQANPSMLSKLNSGVDDCSGFSQIITKNK